MIEYVLAIETSCDDTSVAIVRNDGYVVDVISANQDLAHEPFGGVVPEIACRNHSINLLPLVDKVFQKTGFEWQKIGGVAVTNRPGLVGSLIVGLVTAKTLAMAHDLPLIGVNHLEGHIVAPLLRDEVYSPGDQFKFPYLALAVSGGHTSLYHVRDFSDYEVLGTTLDDAAGEAFDKFAKMLGLGFPGGVKVDQQAKLGDSQKYSFPRSFIKEDNFKFSFSGLKSSAHRLLSAMSPEDLSRETPHLCASFQEAIVDVLLAKLDLAVHRFGIPRVVITGGVSANSRLRERAQAWAKDNHLDLLMPPLRYCTDNAAMIGYAGVLRLNQGQRHPLSLGPSPSSWSEDFKHHDQH